VSLYAPGSESPALVRRHWLALMYKHTHASCSSKVVECDTAASRRVARSPLLSRWPRPARRRRDRNVRSDEHLRCDYLGLESSPIVRGPVTKISNVATPPLRFPAWCDMEIIIIDFNKLSDCPLLSNFSFFNFFLFFCCFLTPAPYATIPATASGDWLLIGTCEFLVSL
jgi:hypothetical protein